MMKRNSLVCVFLAAICVTIPVSYGFTWPETIPKCTVGDGSCIAKTFTNIVQHYDEYPEFGIPLLEPYSPTGEWVLRSSGANLPLTFALTTSNMHISGFKSLLVKEFSGLTPDLKSTKISAKFSVPAITVTANFTSTAKIAMMSVKPEGVLTMDFTDVETPLTLDGEFVKLDGKDYYVIKTVNAHMEVSLMKLETKCKNLYGWVNKKLNSVFNDHWKLFKSELDESLNKYIGDIINEILKPVLEKVAVQDLYQN